jgi:hypothetical protein
MGDAHRFAVIPTHDRPDDLAALVAALAPQCHDIVVIDNASSPPVDAEALNGMIYYVPDLLATVTVLRDEEQPPNLYRLWNVGFDWCAARARMDGLDAWDVAVFNDDAVIGSTRWYDVVAKWLRAPSQTAAVAHTHTYGDSHRPGTTRTHEDPMELHERMCPWAFVVRGEIGLRGDERLRWWWGDTDFEIHARNNGGVLAVPGPQVANSKANQSTTGVLAEQAGRDREMFKQIHGSLPW